MKRIAGILMISAIAFGVSAGELGDYGAFQASRTWVAPIDPVVLDNLRKWQDMKLGIMIHWGTYSQWGIVESWSLVTTRHPWNKRPASYTNLSDRAYQQAYENLITTFNPTNFNPSKWAIAIRDSGARYAVLTTKHHDGFCMWDTATTDYKLSGPQSPFRRDPRSDAVRSAMSAFRSTGLKTGLYFSKADWHHPGYWIRERGPGSGQGPNYDPKANPELWRTFKDYTWQQIEELVSKYGPHEILWLDGGAVRPPNASIDMDGLAAMARSHLPGLIVVDRTVHGANENYITPEGEIPDHYLPYPWETCMTMGRGWTWRTKDEFKSVGTIIRNLCRIVARNGNYLIGIGPDGTGEFDPVVYERLAGMGDWLERNGEAIYSTRPVTPYESGDLVFTRKQDGTRYAIVLAKDDAAGLPESVQLPAEWKAGGRDVQLVGAPSTLPVNPDGRINIPVSVRAKSAGQLAWALRLAP